MENLKTERRILSKVSTLSAAGYKVLGQLQKGRAYRVHGAWRLRGTHAPLSGATVGVLLTKGLAERVDVERHVEVRITPAGSSVNRQGAGAATARF
jgi:hypothetical protein